MTRTCHKAGSGRTDLLNGSRFGSQLHFTLRTAPVKSAGPPTRSQSAHCKSFASIVRSVSNVAVERLLRRAALANRLAKLAGTAHARRLLYAQKAAAVVRLVACGAGEIEEVLLARSLITVRLVNGRRMHLPVDQLPQEIRRRVTVIVQEKVAAA